MSITQTIFARNTVSMTDSKKNVTRCQLIFHFFARITLKVVENGLDSRQDSSLGHKMDASGSVAPIGET